MAATDLQQAVTAIKQGGIVAYPTEAIFGLGCHPANEQAVLRLLALKQRPQNKGLILVASDVQQLSPWIQPLTPQQQKLIENSQHTSWLVPALATTPNYLTGQFDTQAIRLSQHPIVRQLCQQCDSALVSTSANPADKPPAATSQQVKNYFGDQLAFILDGALGQETKPSKIIDLSTQQTIRN